MLLELTNSLTFLNPNFFCKLPNIPGYNGPDNWSQVVYLVVLTELGPVLLRCIRICFCQDLEVKIRFEITEFVITETFITLFHCFSTYKGFLQFTIFTK